MGSGQAPCRLGVRMGASAVDLGASKTKLIETSRCPVPEIPEGDYKGQEGRDPQEPNHFHDSMEEQNTPPFYSQGQVGQGGAATLSLPNTHTGGLP